MERNLVLNQLKYFRKKNNLTLEAVSQAIGYKSPSHINEWEKGKRVPNYLALLKLAILYGCFTDDFYPLLRHKLKKEIQTRLKSRPL